MARPLMQVAAGADESPASGGKKPRKKKDKNAPKNVRNCSRIRCKQQPCSDPRASGMRSLPAIMRHLADRQWATSWHTLVLLLGAQAKTAFMGFSAARRAEVKEADPSLSFGDIAKRIAELWKAATPEEKAPFEADAAQDKVTRSL